MTRRNVVLAGAVFIAVLTFELFSLAHFIGLRTARASPVLSRQTINGQNAILVADQHTRRIFVLSAAYHGAPAQVTVLDAHTGAVLRRVSVGSHTGSQNGHLALAVDQQTGGVIAAVDGYDATGPTVSLLDGTTGKVQAPVQLPAVSNALAIDEHTQRVFVASTADAPATVSGETISHSTICILSAVDGKLFRRLRVTGTITAITVGQQSNQALAISQNSFTGSNRSTSILYILDGRSGQVVQRHALHTMLAATYPHATVDGAHHLVLNSNKSVILLDTWNGTTVGTAVTYGEPSESAVVDRGRRIVVTSEGRGLAPVSHIILLDAITAGVIHLVTIRGDTFGMALDEKRGHVLIAKARAYDRRGGTFRPMSGPFAESGVIVLDAHTGVVRRLIPLNGVPTDVAVDVQSGHAFIVSNGSCGQSSFQRWLPFLPLGSAPGAPQCVSMVDASR